MTRPAEELRLALVLNGGVSLAVWISGVVCEIDALRRATDPAGAETPETLPIYRALCQALGTAVRVDVIAGTSAGGLNGAVLAADVAAGRSFAGVRDLWLQLGQLGDLLRKDSGDDLLSLLDGEGAFYGPLRDWLARLPPPGFDEHDPRTRMRAIFPTTDIDGVSRSITDSFGKPMSLSEHRLRFRFAHEPDPGLGLEAWWAPLRGDAAPLAEALARAARSTSSFPLAFEPSRIQADQGSLLMQATVTRDGRPVFRQPGHRWAADGGILDNSPIGSVLETIRDSPADPDAGAPAIDRAAVTASATAAVDAARSAAAQGAAAPPADAAPPPNIRRAVIFVVPYADDRVQAPQPTTPPLTRVLDTTFNMPRDVSLTDYLEELAQYLDRRERSHTSWRELLRLPHATLAGLAGDVFGQFVEFRAQATIGELALRYRLTVEGVVVDESTTLDRTEVARTIATATAGQGPYPWLPEKSPWPPGATAADGWGGAPAARTATRMLDLLAESLDPESDLVRARDRDSVLAAKRALHWALRTYRVAEQGRQAAERGLFTTPPTGSTALNDAIAAAKASWSDPAGVAVVAAAGSLLGVAGYALQTLAAAVEPTTPYATALQANVAQEDTAAAVVDRLLAADVASRALAGPSAGEHEVDVRLRFMRFNAEAPVPFGTGGAGKPERKLFGMQLFHFAGFERRSWRANDWMWGRLDGASQLVDVLLSDDYVRVHGVTNADLHRELDRLLGAAAPATAGSTPTPAELVGWRRAVRAALQRAIVTAELPEIARQDAVDVQDGFQPGSAVPDPGADPEAALGQYYASLSSGAGIAGRVTQERSSRAGKQLVGHAAAVAAGVLAAPESGLPGPLLKAAELAHDGVRALGWFKKVLGRL